MDREGRKEPEPKVCSECGSELAVETRFRDGVPVTIAVCTGFPDCSYFRWSAWEGGDDSRPLSEFEELGSWAVKESLSVLHDELSPGEWKEALDVISEPSEEEGGPGG